MNGVSSCVYVSVLSRLGLKFVSSSLVISILVSYALEWCVVGQNLERGMECSGSDPFRRISI